ncbi:MAG TPA: ATP-binding cassette domain-containing protein [Acidimicrobiia bacterium]|nr:ATP-binding cassette domain-containing protein [Acidimicrobiia bacterium]
MPDSDAVSDPVVVSDLRKVFKVPVRDAGVRASVRSLVRREHREVVAVDDISFRLSPGEIVGFLGPNGAGKTTTIKMLSGLLHADGGDARVLGHQPWLRSKDLLSRIALVMGQRNNLQWDLPAADSFELNRAVYQIPEAEFQQRKTAYTELLDVDDLMTKPVRNLSLGERMKMEIVGALLHGPEVLFLDEPTIGLDVSMQKRLRQFLLDYNRETGATVLLTSHYMADVVALAQRVIVIHHGMILYDGNLAGLASRFAATKTVRVTAPDLPDDFSTLGVVIERTPDRVVLEVERAHVAAVAATLLSGSAVTDLTIEDPPIDDVIDRIFSSEEG